MTGLKAFVVSLASSAAIHFGDMPSPDSGVRTPPNLEGAAQMIDILSLLEQATDRGDDVGNLLENVVVKHG